MGAPNLQRGTFVSLCRHLDSRLLGFRRWFLGCTTPSPLFSSCFPTYHVNRSPCSPHGFSVEKETPVLMTEWSRGSIPTCTKFPHQMRTSLFRASWILRPQMSSLWPKDFSWTPPDLSPPLSIWETIWPLWLVSATGPEYHQGWDLGTCNPVGFPFLD